MRYAKLAPFLLVVSLLLASCGLGASASSCKPADLSPVTRVVRSFQDSYHLALFANARDLGSILAQLKGNLTELQIADVKECAQPVKQAGVNYFQASINLITAFLADPTSPALQDMASQATIAEQVYLATLEETLGVTLTPSPAPQTIQLIATPVAQGEPSAPTEEAPTTASEQPVETAVTASQEAAPQDTATPLPTETPLPSATPEDLPLVTVTAPDGVNVRVGPSGNFVYTIVLPQGFVVQATGRNEAGDWIQIQHPDIPGGGGWVFGALVELSVPVNSLPVAPTPTPSP